MCSLGYFVNTVKVTLAKTVSGSRIFKLVIKGMNNMLFFTHKGKKEIAGIHSRVFG